MSQHPPTLPPGEEHAFTNKLVRIFLRSNLSIILILLASLVGLAALGLTPREEDPQIVVPLADIYVNYPGHSAAEVEQLVATPLEKILYQIDGVEYVYSMSHEGQAVITVRYYVGEDRERSLVKLYKKIDENLDLVPPGVTGWVVKPVEIDDVPIVTLTLRPRDQGQAVDELALRRVAEETTERLASVANVSRAYVVGGRSRVVYVYLDPDALNGYNITSLEIDRALAGANVTRTAGDFARNDRQIAVEVRGAFSRPEELRDLVVGVSAGGPVFLKDVARIVDGPAEVTSYVRHGWGPGRGFAAEPGMGGTPVSALAGEGKDAHAAAGENARAVRAAGEGGKEGAKEGAKEGGESVPAVTIALAKKKGSNAVWVAQAVLAKAAELEKTIIPSNMELVVTRNYGRTADEKVNELVEALAVAVLIVIALLTLGLGWRESLIVAVAVPVVFGLTLAVNLMFGFTINRVTLFALILALGLLVDDPIVDVENIARHFALRRKATRDIVLEAVAEIRPPLITATLAVIVSFLPMFFITGMMGPYMRPMALNVPVTMLMSMVVAFTITPWLAYHMLKGKWQKRAAAGGGGAEGGGDPHDIGDIKKHPLYRIFYPLMAPLLHHRWAAWLFLGIIALLTGGAMLLAAERRVPLKMLPFDNKNELLLVLDADRGTTLERTDAGVRDLEEALRQVPEVTDFTSYVGLASPMDFNGLVRHYYLREGPAAAEIRINLVGKKNRSYQSHGLGLRVRDELTAIAQRHHLRLKLVEVPPGPPVLASVVAEVYGQPDHRYSDLTAVAKTVKKRLEREPGVVDTDDTVQAEQVKAVYLPDLEKARLSGVDVQTIARTLETALGGTTAGTLRVEGERTPLMITLRVPRAQRSSPADLSQLYVKGTSGARVSLAELGRWQDAEVDQTIYHKNLERVAYVFAETAGRPPADVVVDVQADLRTPEQLVKELPRSGVIVGQGGFVDSAEPRPVEGRSFFSNGSGVRWAVPAGMRVDFAGEGEWKITLDVFRDLGLAFAAAMVAIYILLVAQTGSFVVPVVVMLAIPLTVLGVMPGFWFLNQVAAQDVGGYRDAVYFTATGMIGMIALAGIVTRDAIILVDFIHLSLKRGRSLFDAIMESRVVRLRPILLTASAAMLSAVPIIVDPIFSGLAWSLIFGLFASTLFTLFVIPVTYWLLYANKPGHGLPVEEEEKVVVRV